MRHQLEIIRPDDWHLHLRSGQMLEFAANMSVKQMGKVIVMPNLETPINSVARAEHYYQQIISILPQNTTFKPLMTLYLTDKTKPDDIQQIANSNKVVAAKLYPAGATTHSDSGVSDIVNIYPALEVMQKKRIPLLIHGEVTQTSVDIFDREAVFIETVLTKTMTDFPELKIVFEHITTKQAVDFVLQAGKNIAATITPHHLLANRNDMLAEGIKPHYFCLPVLKRQEPHQNALLKAATSGNPKFFLGSDSAPHTRQAKESACGCAGIFNAHCAIELYASVFESQNALDKLEGFASKFGADFYELPRNNDTIKLKKQSWTIPNSYEFSDMTVVPFMAGETIHWKLVQ